jgi:Tfp pilus assembly protein PilZ
MERRRTLRVATKPIPVLVCYEKRTLQGEILNLSKKGLFVRCMEMPPIGAEVRVVLKNRKGEKVEIVGNVRWTTDQLERGAYRSPGFGMVFTDWNEAYHDLFEQILFTAKE